MGDSADKMIHVESSTIETSNGINMYQHSPHLNPVHLTTAPSLLSRRIRASFSLSTREGQAQQQEIAGQNNVKPLDITGFKHLLMLLLVTGNIKMIWNDCNQFGFWNAMKYFGFGVHDLEIALCVFGTNLLYMPLALVIECIAARTSVFSDRDSSGTVQKKDSSLTQNVIKLMHLICCLTCLFGGSYLTWVYVRHPLIATGCEANVIVTFLKLTSFALTNHELRIASLKKNTIPSFYEAGPAYPDNLSLSNIVNFWAAPTLVYQPVYPTRSKIRWSRIFPLIGEIVTGMILIWALMMQLGLPVLEHMVENLSSLGTCFEDFMTFVPISVIVWLVGFVLLFQSILNLAAEITRFADRNFYGDWWNAGNLGTFWREWNRPVSNYFRRHIYTPLRAAGVSRMMASNAVFFASALLHELLFGVVAHTFNGVAFLCLMVQPLLILATDPLDKLSGQFTTIGNCIFWLSILFGQPVAVVIYFIEWCTSNPENKLNARLWRLFTSS